MGARDDVQIGAFLAGVGDEADRRLGIVNGHDKDAGIAQACSFEDIGTRRVTQKALVAKAAHQGDLLVVVVQHNGLEARGLNKAVHDLPKAPDARDDHRPLFVDLVVGARLMRLARTFGNDLVQDEKQRRDQHGQGDDQQQGFGRLARQHALRHGKGDEDEAEFAPLGQSERKEPAVAPPQLEEGAQNEQDGALDDDD